MFKKLKDKLTEEVQQLSQLSPFTAGTTEAENSQIPQGVSDELLVDISSIKPAGFNKELFSIDEDSREEPLNANTDFQTIELTEENERSIVLPTLDASQYSTPFEPGASNYTSIHRRRGSESSNISDASTLFPLYEVPNASFNFSQCEVESCASEWDEGSSPLDKLSKDAIYQAYGRMKIRYHKYKGRYADLSQAYKEKDKEVDKIKEVLTKTQDKAVRRIAELREQCTLEQQAKAHLEQEFRNDLEEKDHKISAMQTKVKLLQDGCLNEINVRTSILADASHEEERVSVHPSSNLISLTQPEENEVILQSHEDGDTLSVGSFSSISTSHLAMESEELIDKLKGDVAKYKGLLSRCTENIKVNKERIATHLKERDLATSQLQERNASIEAMQVEHAIELESLRATVESSALSMAETKQHMFTELQTKESEVEHYRDQVLNLQSEVENFQSQLSQMSDTEIVLDAVKADEICMDDKCKKLEELVCSLQLSKKSLELKLQSLTPTLQIQSMTPTSIEPAIEETLVSKEYLANEEQEITQSTIEDQISNLRKELEVSRNQLIEVNFSREKFKKIYEELEVDNNSKVEIIGELGREKEAYAVQNVELNYQIDALQKQNASLETKLAQSLEDESTLSTYKEKITELQTDIANSLTIQEKFSREVIAKDSLISQLQKQNTTTNDLQKQVDVAKTNLHCLKDQCLETLNDLKKEALSLCSGEIQTKTEQLCAAEIIIKQLNADLDAERSKTVMLAAIQEKLLQSESEITSFQAEVDILKSKITKEETARFEMQELLCNYGEGLDNNLGKKYNSAVSFEAKLSLIINANKDLFHQVTKLTNKQMELAGTVTEKDSTIDKLKIISDENSHNMQKEMAIIKSNLNENERENVSLRNELNVLTDKLKLSNQLESEFENIKEKMAAVEKELTHLQADKDHYVEKTKELKSQLMEKDNQIIDEQKHLEEKNILLDQLKLDISSKDTEIGNLSEKISDIQNHNCTISKDLSEKTSQVDTGKLEISDLSLKLDTSMTTIDELKIDINNFSANTNQLQSHITDLENKLEETANSGKHDINILTEKLSEEKRKLSETQRESAECMANRENQFREEISHIDQRLSESIAEIARLQLENANFVIQMETAKENDSKLMTDKIHELELQASSMNERENSLLSEIGILKEKLGSETKNNESIKENIKHLEEEIQKLNAKLLERKLELEKCAEDRITMEQESDNLNNSLKQIISKHEVSLDERSTIMNDLQEKNNVLENRITEILNSQKEDSLTKSNQECDLLEKQVAELSSMRLQYSRIAEEKQVLESKLEEISNENCLLTDDVKILNANNEKLKDNADSEAIRKEELSKEIHSLRELCCKYEIDIKSKTTANNEYIEKSIDLSKSIANLGNENDSLLAEVSKLKSIERKFSELQQVETDVRLSESNLKEKLEKEELSKSEMIANIDNLKEKLIATNTTILQYTETFSDLEATCRNLGLRIDVTSDNFDLKTTLTNLVAERNELCAGHTEELSKNKILSSDLENKLVELQANNDRISSKENELSNLNRQINDLESKLRNTEATKIELENLAAAPPTESTYKKEELEERILLVKSEVREHYERLLEKLKETHSIERQEWSSIMEDKSKKIRQESRDQMDKITEEWSNERKELERLTTVAAEAFRNGTESVNLLKQQVQSQRKEIDLLNLNHRKEIARLQQQLLSKFKNGSIGTPLENAAEFDYLRNILYEYMIGNETQTLAKVLCAVVKFNEEQERKIIEIEEQKRSVMSSISNSLKAG